jgi:hypothetical protein
MKDIVHSVLQQRRRSFELMAKLGVRARRSMPDTNYKGFAQLGEKALDEIEPRAVLRGEDEGRFTPRQYTPQLLRGKLQSGNARQTAISSLVRTRQCSPRYIEMDGARVE